MKNLISTLLLGSLIVTNAMAQLSIGINGGLGRTNSSSKQLEFNNDKLYRKDFISNYILGIYGQYRFGKWAPSLGFNYHSQSLKFNDPNTSTLSGGADKLSLKHSASCGTLSLGLKRFFPVNDKTDLYGGLAFNFDFYNMSRSALSNTATANYTTLGPTVLTTKSGITSGTGIGLMPEVGVSIKVGEKSNLIFFGALNLGLNETLHGTVTRSEPSGQVPQSSYTSNSGNTTLGVKYQYTLKGISSEDKQKNALAKEEKRKVKDAEALRKKQEKDKSTSGNDNHEDKKMTYNSEGIPDKLDDRAIEKQNEVIVQSTEIEFFVWDDKQEDKDSISLYINGVWVLKAYELIKKKKVIKVTIDPSKDNYLVMYALNEGKFPPNTCAISIDDGVNGEKRLYLKSTLKSCGAIHFQYKPKQ